jgi:hypothetical protein
MRKTFVLSVNAAMLALIAVATMAKEPGTVRTNAELMAAPYRDAKSAGRIKPDTRVDVVERRGAWVHVTAPEKDGWLRLHEVRLGDGEEKKGSSGLRALWNVGQTGRSGTQGIVATTGIRGMSADQLKSAEPNPAEVEKLESYKANDEQAREHATVAKLKEQKIEKLPKPE